MNYRRHKSTLFLCALAVVLTGVLLWDRGNVSTGEADLRAENFIEAWRPDDVTRVDVAIGGREVALLHERDAEGSLGWVLAEGGQRLDGDEQAMVEYVANLELGMYVRKIEDVDRAALGLEAPRGTIVVHMGQLAYTLRVGGEAPTPKGAGYLEVEGGSRGRVVYVITEPTVNELLIDVAELLAKRLAMYYSPSVQKYAISSSAGTLSLERGGWGGATHGAFLVKAKGQRDLRANRNEVNKLFQAISDVEVKTFVAVPSEPPKDAVTIELTPTDPKNAKVRLSLGTAPNDTCGEGRALAVRYEPDSVAGCVDARLIERLRVTPEELRDRLVVGSDEGDIVELLLASGEEVVDLARKGEGWHMRKPEEGPAEKEPMEQLLLRMVDARGTVIESPDLPALGLDPPRGTLRILGLPERMGAEAGKDRVEKIAVGAVVDGTVHVRREDDGAVLAIDADSGGLFLPRPTLLRSTQVFEEELKYVRGLSVSCGGREQELSRDLSTSWSFVTPKDAALPVDGALATDLIDALRNLKALRWAAERPAERHGLDKPWCKVGLKLVEPDEADPSGETSVSRTLTVHLGGETQGGYFAKTADGDAVFVAPRALGTVANVWFMSRSVLPPTMKDVERMTLRGAGDRALVLERQGEGWKADGGSASLGATVQNALEQLTADIVSHPGPARAASGFDEPVLAIEIQYRGRDEPLRLTVGKAETWRNAHVFNVRRSDLAATFLVARGRVQPLIDAL